MRIRVKLSNGHTENLNLRQPVRSFDYPDGASALCANNEDGTEFQYYFDPNGYYTGKAGIVGNSLPVIEETEKQTG